MHVCKMCVEYDRSYAKHCKEPTAEEVSKKEEANFCDHFKPRARAYTPPNSAAISEAQAALDQLLAAGATANTPVQDVGDGIRVATVRDPFGNVLGIIENPHFAAV